jgi:hypothetical protein
MKTSAKLLVCMIFLQLSLSSYATDDDSDLFPDPPKKAVIISLTPYLNTFTFGIIYTMIDLDNNEMVLVNYGSDPYGAKSMKLRKVVRTGIIIDPEQQKQLMPNFQSSSPGNP